MHNWKRRGNAKPGVPFIPTRKELDEMNRPLREAAEAKKRSKKGQ